MATLPGKIERQVRFELEKQTIAELHESNKKELEVLKRKQDAKFENLKAAKIKEMED